MAKKIQWGILGCGGIAGAFARDLKHSKHGQLHAAGSRSRSKADAFAKTHKAQCAYGSYVQLVADPDIDIIYVGTPHPMHLENTLMAIEAGKHVLCEKPIAMNAAQTRRMIAAARKKDVFLMEAMWTRFFPAIRQVRKWIDRGCIGTIRAVESNFGIHFCVGPKHRIFNPDLGGGALLDVGIYPVSFASWVFGGAQPKKIVSTVHKTDTGVDDHAVIAFEYSGGATAALGTSSIVRLKNESRIYGTEGMIILHDPCHHPNRLTLEIVDKKPRIKEYSQPGSGMQFEADHVHTCLRKGKRQSDIMPLAESLAIMQTMDKIRKQWKLKYPNE